MHDVKADRSNPPHRTDITACPLSCASIVSHCPCLQMAIVVLCPEHVDISEHIRQTRRDLSRARRKFPNSPWPRPKRSRVPIRIPLPGRGLLCGVSDGISPPSPPPPSTVQFVPVHRMPIFPSPSKKTLIMMYSPPLNGTARFCAPRCARLLRTGTSRKGFSTLPRRAEAFLHSSRFHLGGSELFWLSI